MKGGVPSPAPRIASEAWWAEVPPGREGTQRRAGRPVQLWGGCALSQPVGLRFWEAMARRETCFSPMAGSSVQGAEPRLQKGLCGASQG